MDEFEAAVPMNLCFVTPTYFEIGQAINSGVATATHTLAHSLAKAGHRVQVVALSPTMHGSALIDSVRVHYISPDQWHWYLFKVPLLGKFLAHPLRELANSIRLGRIVQQLHGQHAFDVVEATETGSFALAFYQTIPLVIRLHGEEYTFATRTPSLRLSLSLRLTRALQRTALRRAKALIAPSSAHAHNIGQELRIPSARIAIVPHGLPLPNVQHTQPPKTPIVLFVGRLEAVKGICDALIAFAKVQRIVPAAQLVLIGNYHPTQPQAAIESLIAQLAITESVKRLGNLPREKLGIWYMQARVLLVPSYYETFSLVSLEAMAHGLPVVGYTSGALPELIGQAGILVPPGDTDALSQALAQLLTNDQQWQALSAQALERATSYSTERQVEQTIAIYRSVCTRNAHLFHSNRFP